MATSVNRLKDILRIGLGRAVAAALRLRSRPYGIDNGPILVVAPHPDDESLGCGGVIARHAAQGLPVHIVFLTDGEASHPDHPFLAPEGLAKLRHSEALAALAVLGVTEPERNAEFLHAPDGRLHRLGPAEGQSVADALSRRIRDLRPVAVFAPFRHGGSSEHTAAFQLVAAALAAAGGGVMMEYPIWAWWNALRLRSRLGSAADNLRLPLDAYREVKTRAIACHHSQLVPVPPRSEPALPKAILLACSGANEFFFRSRIASAPDVTPPHPSLRI